MKPTSDDLKTAIREAFVLTGTGPDTVARWQREDREAALSPLEAVALVNEVSRQVNDNRLLLDNITGRARRMANDRFNGQLTPDDLVLLSGATQPLGLSAEFVHDRWMPALFATPDPSLPPSPPVADPPPAPTLVPLVSQPIRIEWLVPPSPPDPDLPTLTTQLPTAPKPVAPACCPGDSAKPASSNSGYVPESTCS